jgi:thioredoxin-dependent peroxiredoxin
MKGLTYLIPSSQESIPVTAKGLRKNKFTFLLKPSGASATIDPLRLASIYFRVHSSGSTTWRHENIPGDKPMAEITFKGNPIHTAGTLPKIGTTAPDFKVVTPDLSPVSLGDFKGKRVILNIFPSIDTPVCATSVRRFNTEAGKLPNTIVLCISKDLPFAQKRFCGAEGLDKVITGSEYRDSSFSNAYGVCISDGPLAGLFSRAIVVVDEAGRVAYTEQVPEIAQEPNYEKALAAVK